MIEVDLKPTISKFKKEFEQENNYRTIFSGKFGVGKTFFLNKFFTEIEKDNYYIIRLAPVNYVVANNQDIFELIKFDILFELLKLDIETGSKVFEKSEVEKFAKLPFFLGNRLPNIFKLLLETCALINESTAKLFPLLLILFEKIQESKVLKDWEEFGEIDDLAGLEKYFSSFANDKGSLKEEDQFTNLIRSCLEKLKGIEQYKHKKTVLIIDDLDRIDPDHLFRIFNIFSAHIDIDFNSNDNSLSFHNKFGFDQIIFVCDIDNVQNIFHSRYGNKSDFNGYIRKFHSYRIFYYDIREQLQTKLHRYVDSLVLLHGDTNLLKNQGISLLFKYILECLVYNKHLDVRALKNTYNLNQSFTEGSLGPGFVQQYLKNINYFPLLIIIEALYSILGSYQKILDAVNECANNRALKNPNTIYQYLPSLIIVYHIIEYGERLDSGNYAVTINQEIIHYKILDRFHSKFEIDRLSDNSTQDNFFVYFKDVLTILRERFHMFK